MLFRSEPVFGRLDFLLADYLAARAPGAQLKIAITV
jgi:hypothetical protein